MIYRPNTIPSARRATAAAEAAIILPVILIFAAGIIDLGRLCKYADCVSNAARNGAQAGSASPTAAADSTLIRAAAVTEMANLPKVTATNPTVTATTSTYSGSSYIAGDQFVSVTVSYNTSGIAIFPFFPVNNITRTVQMPIMPSH